MKSILGWGSFFLCAFATADTSPFLSTGSNAYRYVEKLEALGCAYPTFRALGPQTTSDIQAALDLNSETTACEAPEWLLDERHLLLLPVPPPEYRADGFGAVDDRVSLEGIPASIWPTFPLRQNRPTVNGINLSNEFSLAVRTGGNDWGYALSASPGFYLGRDNDTSFQARFYLQEAYAKVGYRFSELTFGRYGRKFGDARHGGLLYSGAAAPLDVVEFALRPVVPSGFFSVMGPVTFRTYMGSQGSDATVSGALLWGVELGLRPFRWWELALTELFQFGGSGTPTLAGGETLQMLLAGGGTGLAGRRNASVALSSAFWLPRRSVKAYGQLLFDRVGDTVTSPLSTLVGFWLPNLGKWDLRAEYARTAKGSYQNPVWTQGLTYRGSTLGHPLGPDGEGAYLDLGLPPIFTWWHSELGALYEARSLVPAAGQQTEWRYGATASLGRRWGYSDLDVKFAYHQVYNAQYVSGVQSNIFAVGGVFRYTFL